MRPQERLIRDLTRKRDRRIIRRIMIDTVEFVRKVRPVRFSASRPANGGPAFQNEGFGKREEKNPAKAVLRKRSC